MKLTVKQIEKVQSLLGEKAFDAEIPYDAFKNAQANPTDAKAVKAAKKEFLAAVKVMDKVLAIIAPVKPVV
jgi:hypothetical protein